MDRCSRPARIGEQGIVMRDDVADGANIGKMVDVIEQCGCEADRHKVMSADQAIYTNFFGNIVSLGHPCTACFRKCDVIVQEDPDKDLAITEETSDKQTA